MLQSSDKRELVDRATSKHSASLQTACKRCSISRQGYHYQAKHTGDHFANILKALAKPYPRYGYWKLDHLMRNQGHKIHHKCVHGPYKAVKLPMRGKTEKGLAGVAARPLLIADQPSKQGLST